MKRFVLSIVIGFSSFLLPAQNGILDTSFGNQGHVLRSLSTDYCSGMASFVLPDSKILVGGFSSFATPQFKWQGLLHKYAADGTLDSSFAVNGEVDSNLLAGNWVIMKLALQPDGKILAIGFYDFSFIGMLARFEANGDLDSSFGTNGVNIIDYSTLPYVATRVDDLALLPDGKILICGIVDDGGLYQSYVSRYTSSGNLDSTFTNGGILDLQLPSNYDFSAETMQVQPDGKILLSGYSRGGIGERMMLVRLLSNGNFDPTFGTNGVVRHAPFISERVQKIILLPNQKILCLGFYGLSEDDIFLSRLLPNGNIDSSYGTGGFVGFNLGAGFGYSLRDAQFFSDHSVVFSITKSIASDSEFILGRVLAHGQLDATFGTNGFIYSNFLGSSSYNSIAVVDDVSFIASGSLSDSTSSSLLLSKYELKSYLSVEEQDLPKPEFKIYPNPSLGTLTISAKKPGTFTLYNALGQQVWWGFINGEPSTLNLQHLPAGLYFMVDEAGASQKIILRKK